MDHSAATALYDIVGQRIAQARHGRSAGPLSQRELAEIVGMSRGSIANIEAGRQRPPLHTLWQIGEAVGIEPRDLLPSIAELAEYRTTGIQLSASERRLFASLGPGAERLKDFIEQVQSAEGRNTTASNAEDTNGSD